MTSLCSSGLAFAKSVFAVAMICILMLFAFGSNPIRIDTNLKDLNPDDVSEQGLKFATDTLIRDISHRFIMVVKSSDEKTATDAASQLQRQLGSIQGLRALSSEDTREDYLSALSPYQFHLLSESQREALNRADSDDLATQAQRKLYQLGDGIRLIPFGQDPLGWFSDYLLNRLDEFNARSEILGETISETIETNQRVEHAEGTQSTTGEYFESFAVSITAYPENMAEQEDLYHAIEGIVAIISNEFQVTILQSGMFFFAIDSAQSAKGDIQFIAIGSAIGVVVLMLLVFRSLLPLCLSLASIALGVSFGILMSTLVFGSVHILTVVFGASLIGIVVDYSLHYFYHFLSIETAGQQQDSSPTQAARGSLHRAMLLSVITSLIGYGALALSDLVLLKKVAFFSCSGLLMAWLSVIVLGPLVTKRPIVVRQALLMFVLKAIHKTFSRHPSKLMGLGLLMASLGGVYLYISDVDTNDDPRLFFHVSLDLMAQEREVARLTQVYEPGRYFIVKGESEKQVYETLESFYEALGKHRTQVISVLDWLPSPDTQKQDYALQEALYRDGGVLDTFYQRLGVSVSKSKAMKVAYAEASTRYLNFPKLVQSLPAIPSLWVEHEGNIYSFVLIRKNSHLASLEAASQSTLNIEYINTLERAIEALEAQRITGSTLLLVAYGLIALMLVLYYRQVSAIFLLLIPITASVLTLSILAAIGQPITVFHIMGLFLVLGLGMDYIIFAKEMVEKQAVTQQAILLSAVTSLLSFGLLAFSSMPIVQAFGSTILIGNSINFIAAISLFNKPQTANIFREKPNV